MVDFAEHRKALLCNDAQSIADYQSAMGEAVNAVSAWLQNDKMYTGGSIKDLRAAISFNPSKQGLGVQQSLQRMIELFLNKSLKVHHPHSLAHLHCPTMVMSQIAEVLINATNQSMDSWDQSPAGSLMEVQLVDWLRQKVGYGAGQAGVFTSGGTQSNLMGVLLARDWCVAKNWKDENGKPWSVQRDGIPADAMKNVKVICSENAHFSVQKNMAMMGMGFQSVVTVPVNENAQMDVDALEKTMAHLQSEGKIVACVVGIFREKAAQVIQITSASVCAVKRDDEFTAKLIGCRPSAASIGALQDSFGQRTCVDGHTVVAQQLRRRVDGVAKVVPENLVERFRPIVGKNTQASFADSTIGQLNVQCDDFVLWLRVVESTQQSQDVRQRANVAVLRGCVVPNPPIRTDRSATGKGCRVGKKINFQRIRSVVNDLVQ